MELNKEDLELLKEDNKEKLRKAYFLLIKILNKYLDLKPEYYDIIALWIIGTYYHKQFITFPYLFLNAVKGSGKSRALRLITTLSWNGELTNNLSESVLFRTAGEHTLGIDELEHIGSKDKSTLRELLNSAYKQGVSVKRVYKNKGKEREEYNTEEFKLYTPIIMANIWGMDEVVGDRCLSLILEKSNKKEVTLLMENFEHDDDILLFKSTFSVGSVVSDAKNNIYTAWNDYILSINNTYTSYISSITNTTYTSDIFFLKIKESGIEGRHLELFFPLFMIAIDIGYLDELINIAKQMIKEKKEEDVSEGRDTSFLEFIARYNDPNDFIPIRKLTNEFKGDDESQWITPEWIGRALKRMGLIIEKKRVGKGREVMINFKKAREKLRMFGIDIKEDLNIKEMII